MILALAAMFLALCASGAVRNYRSEWRNYHSSGQGRAETDRPTEANIKRVKATTCCSIGSILTSSALCRASASRRRHHPFAAWSLHPNSSLQS